MFEIIKFGSNFLKEKKIPSYILDSEILLSKVLNKSREKILTNLDQKINKRKILVFKDYLLRRSKNEPIAYILEEKEFWSKNFKVNKDTLIPRPETELLVDKVLKIYEEKKISILDIGTGSGLISIILKKYLDNSNVEAWDKSIKALEIAKKNSLVNNLKINFKEVDVLKKIEFNNKYDLIVSNPPYVDKSEITSIDVSVSKFEPHSAIFVDGDDNLVFYKKIIEFSKVALNDLGVLYLECHTDRIKSIKNLLKINNFKKIMIKEDLNGRERMIKAYK